MRRSNNAYIERIRSWVNTQCRKLFVTPKLRRACGHSTPSVICNNCIGAMMLHELGQPFNSPFVNLWIPPADYIYLVSNLSELVNERITDITDKHQELGYPVGLLADRVTIHFMHYKNFDEAVAKWKERSARIDYNNIRLMFVSRDGATHDDLLAFDQLPYRYNVAFANVDYPDVKCLQKIVGCNDGEELGQIFAFKGWTGKKYYDDFDFVNFFFPTENCQ